MTQMFNNEIYLGCRSHRAALSWLGLLYRTPNKFIKTERSLSRRQQAAVALQIYLHTVPYLLLISITGRWLLRSLEPEATPFLDDLTLQGIYLGTSLIGGLAVGLAGSFVFGLTIGLAVSLVVGLAGGLAGGFAGGLAGSLVVGLTIPIGLHLASTRSLSRTLALSLIGGLATGLVGVLAVDLATGLCMSIGFYLVFFRCYYFPFHFYWLWPRPRPDIYILHPIAWDNACLLPFPGLGRLLVAYAEHHREAGECEIDRLIAEYPSQRAAALLARAILVARRAAAAEIAQLDEVLAALPIGTKGFIAVAPELRQRVQEIVVLQARIDTLDRPFLREPFAELLVKDIEMFLQQVTHFKPPLAIEMRRAAQQWLGIARNQLETARIAVAREPMRQVFRAGEPVDREQEAFVQRTAILSELEQQVMLANGCPGLLVYGRWRMGKSTLVRNLAGLLPPQIKIVNLSMQQPAAFTSLSHLVELITSQVSTVVKVVSSHSKDLAGLSRFLGEAQQCLETENCRLLLTIDEYENIDQKIGEGVLPVDFLAVVRDSIHSHRRIIWTFVGSHVVDELNHAPWVSYLVDARTIEVTPFELAETRLLLTEPLKDSSLWLDVEAGRPRFAPGFWGDGGIDRIHAEAGGWPHLVQLVAQTIVDLANDTGSAFVDSTLFERALDRAVVRGNNAFIDLLENESQVPGEWAYLQGFYTTKSQPPPTDNTITRSLLRRRLILANGDLFRLRVPLMARWLQQRI